MASGTPFTLDMTGPFKSGWTGGLGGPGVGGHVSPQWYIQFGMDLGVAAGTEVFAAFDCYVHRFNPHVPSNDTAKQYGAQLFVRSNNDPGKHKLSGFYTHFTGTKQFAAGEVISKGDRLGTILRDHLHFALVENLPEGRERGVLEVYPKLVMIKDTFLDFSVAFKQDGTKPDVT